MISELKEDNYQLSQENIKLTEQIKKLKIENKVLGKIVAKITEKALEGMDSNDD